MSSENTLFKLIENYLEERFNRFLSLIPYDKDKCLEAWRESEIEISKLEKPVNLTKTKKGKKVEKKTEEVSDESDKDEDEKEEKKGKKGKSSTSETGTCIYVLTKGKRKDQTCDKKVSEGSYCSTHKKHENSSPKSKSVPDTPKVRDSTASTSSSKSKGGNTRNITKHSETDMLWHPQTGIAFSMDEKGTPVVTNKIVNDKVQELKNEDFETVFKWGFPLSEKLKKTLEKIKKTEDAEEKKEKKEKKKENKAEKGKKQPVQEESDADSSDEEVEKMKEKKEEKKEKKSKKVEKEESEIESDDD